MTTLSNRRWAHARLMNLMGLREKQFRAATIVHAVELIGVGAVIGVGAAILFAPSSGRQFRDEWAYRLANITGRILRRSDGPLDDPQLAGA